MVEERIPHLYADGYVTSITPYGVGFRLMARFPAAQQKDGQQQEEQHTVGYLSMSLEHAKCMCILLKRLLKAYEAQQIPITLPPAILTQLSIKTEDW